MSIIMVKSHELLPFYLRRIRLGSDAAVWVTKGVEFLQKQAKHYLDIYADDRQKTIQLVLRQAMSYLESRFAIPYDEEVHIGGFVPWGSGPCRLQLAFHFKGRRYGDRNIVTEAHAEGRQLQVVDLERPQGAAGYAFLRGAVTEASRAGAALDAHFTPEMQRDWGGRDKTFRALLCVPIFDSADWVPIGVAYINSNFSRPFWSGLEIGEYLDLQEFLRAMFREILEYDRGVSPGSLGEF